MPKAIRPSAGEFRDVLYRLRAMSYLIGNPPSEAIPLDLEDRHFGTGAILESLCDELQALVNKLERSEARK